MTSITLTKDNCYRHLEEKIDLFENEMLEMIKDVANNTRKKLYRLMDEQIIDTRQQHGKIASELDCECEKDDYYESNFKRLINNMK
jgi:hypothetical protein